MAISKRIKVRRVAHDLSKLVFESKRISKNVQERFDYVRTEMDLIKPKKSKTNPKKAKKPSGYISRIRYKNDPRFKKLGMFQREIMEDLRAGFYISRIDDRQSGQKPDIWVTDGDDDLYKVTIEVLKSLIDRKLLKFESITQRTTDVVSTIYKFEPCQ